MDFLDEIRDEGRKEGLAEGLAEGLEAGRIHASRTLLGLLARKFGPVPREAKQRILEADEKKLSRWTLRVLDAGSIDEVVGNKKAGAAPRKRATPATRRASTSR